MEAYKEHAPDAELPSSAPENDDHDDDNNNNNNRFIF